MRWTAPWYFVVAVLLTGGPAAAQVLWDMDNITGKKHVFQDGPTVALSRPDAWPRLDRGTVLCRTEGDLLRLAASRRGEPGPRPDCQVIREPTPIQITHRAGPGRTQVAVTGQTLEGWTDAWLPEKAPPSGGRIVSIRPEAPR